MKGMIALCMLDDNDKILVKKEISAEWSDSDVKIAHELLGINLQEEIVNMVYHDIIQSIDKQFISGFVNEIERKKNER